MTLRERWRWLLAAFGLLRATAGAAQQVIAALPHAEATGDPMQAFSSDQIDTAKAFLQTDPRALAVLAGVKAFAGGDAGKLMHAFQAHDWATVVETGLLDALTIANAAGVPFAGAAMKALPWLEFMAQHPAPVESPAMKKASGAPSPYDHDGGGAYPTGAI